MSFTSSWKRYEVDKIVNGPSSVVTLYENSLEQKFREIEEKENDHRKKELLEEENLRDKKVHDYVLQKHHIIKTDSKLTHVLTGITVDTGDCEILAQEKLRLLVAETSIKVW